MHNKVYITNQQNVVKIPTGIRILIRRSCNAVLEMEGFDRPAEISVTFVDNAHIAQLNGQYRNKPVETDVLSFPLGSDGKYDVNEETGAAMLGDIVISMEKAFEQANIYGHSLQREVAFSRYIRCCICWDTTMSTAVWKRCGCGKRKSRCSSSLACPARLLTHRNKERASRCIKAVFFAALAMPFQVFSPRSGRNAIFGSTSWWRHLSYIFPTFINLPERSFALDPVDLRGHCARAGQLLNRAGGCSSRAGSFLHCRRGQGYGCRCGARVQHRCRGVRGHLVLGSGHHPGDLGLSSCSVVPASAADCSGCRGVFVCLSISERSTGI